jgi:SAM-dependent methyltransferase
MIRLNKILNTQNYIPADYSDQANLDKMISKIINDNFGSKNILRILDLGCGQGNSIGFFNKISEKIEWFGIDLENSPEASGKRSSKNFHYYDGLNIPFEDNYFDIIYCKQVFEHVRYPEQLILDILRVLKKGGFFVGTTSHLEPYHSLSLWNYTPYGFNQILVDSGFSVLEIRPGIDSITLIIRRALGCPKFLNIFWRIESPLNLFVSVGRILGISHYKLNSIKLLFCGQFLFIATKIK